MRLPVPCPDCTNGYVIAVDGSDAWRCAICGGEGFRWVTVTRANFLAATRQAKEAA